MTKKDLLSIPQITPDFGFGSSTSNIPLDPGDSESSNQRNIATTTNQQMANMEAYAKKTIHAMAKMTDINNNATEQFYEIIENITDFKSKSRGKEHEATMEQFGDAMTKVAGQQMLGTVKIGSAAIAGEVSRQPYTSYVKKNFLEKLLGK